MFGYEPKGRGFESLLGRHYRAFLFGVAKHVYESFFDSQNCTRAEAAGKILVDNKASAYENFIAGNKLYERKEYEKAVAKYTEAIELNPSYGEAYYNRILANGELGNYVQVIEDYFTITKTDPKLASPDNEIGEWQKKAIEYYSREIELNPNDRNLWFYRGYANRKRC